MVFTSLEFLLIFLPIVLLLFYFSSKTKYTNTSLFILLSASLIFYGWWKWEYVFLLLISITTNYCFGRALLKFRKLWVIALGISFNIFLLGYFKYVDFLINSINSIFIASVPVQGILLPLAISFYTFQQIAYLIDIYRGETKQTKFSNYALFVCFFPQFIAGPIVHHRETVPQFENKGFPKWSKKDFFVGATIFAIGFNKKVIIADSIAIIANQVFDNLHPNEPSFFEAWCGAIAYSFQIYFDFSGYSDMAIGLARMFGIKLPINFHSPYKALNIIEFWRNWHITLSRFLRNYLYIPLGGNRNGKIRRYLNILVVMLIGGIWHGAGWNFAIWGGLHGLFLIINHMWQNFYIIKGYSFGEYIICIWFSRLLTFFAVTIAWVFFRSENFNDAICMIEAMIGLNGIFIPNYLENFSNNVVIRLFDIGVMLGDLSIINITNMISILVLFFIIWFCPNSHELLVKNKPALDFPSQHLIQNLKYGFNSKKIKYIIYRLNDYPRELLICFYSGTIVVGTLLGIYRGELSTEFIYFIF